MSITELREQYKGKDFIPYSELLKTDEWKEKREVILQRDNHMCTYCGRGDTIEQFNSKNNKLQYFWFKHEGFVVTETGEQPYIDAIESLRPIRLEIHHTLYVLNRLPWENENGELTTFCNWCHWDFHKHNHVDIYTEDMMSKLSYTPCIRCNGAGGFPEYSHVQGGVCFRCSGAMYEELIRK